MDGVQGAGGRAVITLAPACLPTNQQLRMLAADLNLELCGGAAPRWLPSDGWVYDFKKRFGLLRPRGGLEGRAMVPPQAGGRGAGREGEGSCGPAGGGP
jgi:hypothetical protein